jgi:hypothetical protein
MSIAGLNSGRKRRGPLAAVEPHMAARFREAYPEFAQVSLPA